MLNLERLLKVSVIWMSIAYAVCFFVVAALPTSRSMFMMYGLHSSFDMGNSVTTFGTFVSGLIVWDVLTILGVWLFVALYNSIKK